MNVKGPPPATCAPLAQLNRYIRGARAAANGKSALPGATLEPDELASAHRFMRAWENCRTDDEVRQAVARMPVNAGPLNSHLLVLQALGMMQALSPDYLRRFLAHVEALQWLEQAREAYPHPQAPPAKGKAKTASVHKAAKPVPRSTKKK